MLGFAAAAHLGLTGRSGEADAFIEANGSMSPSFNSFLYDDHELSATRWLLSSSGSASAGRLLSPGTFIETLVDEDADDRW